MEKLSDEEKEQLEAELLELRLEHLDLETALGITNTRDATFIKFDFTPTTDNITFRYLMASEEYNMNDECNFADGFGFLLRVAGSTDPFRNLAVLPDGTPVNVTNINGIICEFILFSC